MENNNRRLIGPTYIAVWPAYTLAAEDSEPEDQQQPEKEPSPEQEPSPKPQPRRTPKPQPSAAAAPPRRRRTTKGAEIKPLILKAMETCAPAIVDGIAKAAGLESKQVNPRMNGLMESGKVRLTGRKLPGDSGVLQREWDLVR